MNTQIPSKEVTKPIVKIRMNRQVTIPKRVFDALGLKEGDFVEVVKLDNTVVITPKRLVDTDEVLTRDEEELVQQGFAELERGESVVWNTLKHDLELRDI